MRKVNRFKKHLKYSKVQRGLCPLKSCIKLKKGTPRTTSLDFLEANASCFLEITKVMPICFCFNQAEKIATNVPTSRNTAPMQVASQSEIDKLLEDIDLPAASTGIMKAHRFNLEHNVNSHAYFMLNIFCCAYLSKSCVQYDLSIVKSTLML